MQAAESGPMGVPRGKRKHPIHFPAGCREVRINQAFSVIHLILGFFRVFLLCTRATVTVLHLLCCLFVLSRCCSVVVSTCQVIG